MKIFIEKEKKEIDFKITDKKKIKDILNELEISRNSVIIVKNDNIALDDDLVDNQDKLKLLSVVSGG